MRRRIARCCFVGWGLVNQSAATHCLLGGRRPVYLKMPVGERWSGCRRLVYGSDRVSPRNYTKVALPLSVIPHVLSLSIWPSGRLHRSRQTRAKTLRHLGRDSSALGARQLGTYVRTVFRTLRHQCRSVRTVRTHQTSAKVSKVQSVLGPKCP